MRYILFLCYSLCLCKLVFAQSQQTHSHDCKKPTKFANACYSLKGSLYSHLGSPNLRIYPDFSHRVLDVANSGNEEAFIPREMRSHLVHGIHADFLICPLPKTKKDQLQLVCVQEMKTPEVMPSP